MVSSGKLSTDPSYYVSQVAPRPGAYYVGSGEKPGTWVGRGCADLDLSGEVTAGALAAVLGGADPASGSSLVTGKAAAAGRMGGSDLTGQAGPDIPPGWDARPLGQPNVAQRSWVVFDPHRVAIGTLHGRASPALRRSLVAVGDHLAGLAPAAQLWTRRLHHSPAPIPTRR